MTFHRLMIAAALLLAAVGLKIYLPEAAGVTLSAVQALINEQTLAIPQEAVAWMDWR